MCNAVHAHAKLDAHSKGELLYYIPAVDRVAARGIGRKELDEMRSEPNCSKAGRLLSVLPVFVGMEMVLDETAIPGICGKSASCKVVAFEVHPNEPQVDGTQESVVADGCVVLRYMPKCIYVRVRGCDVYVLPVCEGFDVKGVVAIKPTSRHWTFTPSTFKRSVDVSRTQMPLLPRRQCTLHGVQGKTATPGFIAHWCYPKLLSKEHIWLAHYVSLSRPERLSDLLSHGLPSREVIEGGPPAEWLAELDALFPPGKIARTKAAAKAARKSLGSPAVAPWTAS